MKSRFTGALLGSSALLLALLTLELQLADVRAQSAAFTYQGRLGAGTAPANGVYELAFTLYDAATGGNLVAGPITTLADGLSNGLFTVTLDFGPGMFNGAGRWLEVGVRTNGAGAFTLLTPRQRFTSAPYAIRAASASSADAVVPNGVTGGSIQTGAVTADKLPAGQVVKSLNSLKDDVTLAAGANVTITPSGNTLTISSTGGGANGWSLTGNLGTTPGVNFLGTTDNQALELKVNGLRALRLEPGASNSVNVVAGWLGNNVAPGVVGATVGGGGAGDWFGLAYTNKVESSFGTVSGGRNNQVQSNADSATIGGGYNNTIQPNAGFATIVGGLFNVIRTNAGDATIGGGSFNSIQSFASKSTIGGGDRNTVRPYALYATIGGGIGNAIQTNAFYGTIGGGQQNTIETNADHATIGGGWLNSVELGDSSTVAGGSQNRIQQGAASSSIGGGTQNWIEKDSSSSVIGGGYGNTVRSNAYSSTIAGGAANVIGTNSFVSTIAGGERNLVRSDSPYSTIGGGSDNRVANSSTVAGGLDNSALHFFSTVGGGVGNTNIGHSATIGGGAGNTNSGSGATIGGGRQNDASGYVAAIPGGEFNRAAGDYSFASGRRAKALHNGALVWADSVDADFSSTAENEVSLRAAGGYRLFSNGAATTGAALAAGGGSWTSLSDRHAKENFAGINAREVLEKVAALPLSTWNYRSQDASIRHIGPMAQDFKAAFGVGESDTGITTVDADGVALAAIQGLNSKLKDKEGEIQDLKQRVTALEEIVRKLHGSRVEPK